MQVNEPKRNMPSMHMAGRRSTATHVLVGEEVEDRHSGLPLVIEPSACVGQAAGQVLQCRYAACAYQRAEKRLTAAP